MDSHTLELLDFEKVRILVAARAACSLGKSAALGMEPSLCPSEIHERQALTTEMAEALAAGLRPPFGGLHDIRHHVRRCEQGGVLEAEALAETVEALRAVGNLDRWLSLPASIRRLVPCAWLRTAVSQSKVHCEGDYS